MTPKSKVIKSADMTSAEIERALDRAPMARLAADLERRARQRKSRMATMRGHQRVSLVEVGPSSETALSVEAEGESPEAVQNELMHASSVEDQMRKKTSTPVTAPKEFTTPDLYLAAFLQTSGVNMVRTERVERRVFFIFDAADVQIEGLKAAWVNNSGRVAAQPYSHSIKSLKALCHMA